MSLWLLLAAVLAVLQWIARWYEIRWLHYLTKPTVMLALMAWLWTSGGWGGPLRWFSIGLIFSLLGDVFLMLPPSFFLAGLGAFLLGHLFYIIGFNSGALPFTPWLGVLAGVGILVAAGLIRYFLTALRKLSYSRRIRAAVVAYILVITSMVVSAFSTFQRPAWGLASALLVSCGAVLFAGSDSLLAYDRFVKRVKHAHLWIMMSYHFALFLILQGALIQFA